MHRSTVQIVVWFRSLVSFLISNPICLANWLTCTLVSEWIKRPYLTHSNLSQKRVCLFRGGGTQLHWRCVCVLGGGAQLPGKGGGGGGALPLWESVGMRRGFAPMFGIWTIFSPPKIWPCLLFYSDLVGSHFEATHFQHVDALFAPQIDQIYHLIQNLLGPVLNFERRYWFWPAVVVLWPFSLFLESWATMGAQSCVVVMALLVIALAVIMNGTAFGAPRWVCGMNKNSSGGDELTTKGLWQVCRGEVCTMLDLSAQDSKFSLLNINASTHWRLGDATVIFELISSIGILS